MFNVSFLRRTWNYGETRLFRAESLYTAQNYNAFLETFRKNFPDYVYFCPFREKNVISAPLDSIRKVFVPRECLHYITHLKIRDRLQRMTLDFISLVSNASGIALEDFGIHGSVALGMHTEESDIDVVVYGSQNFRKLERAVSELVERGKLSYRFNNRIDAARRFKGQYKGRIFMYNAVRKPEEVDVKYGALKYSPITPVAFTCTVKNDCEAMFRPAIYDIANYKPINPALELPRDKIPQLVVSMIGCYRNVARKGDSVRVSGMLEQVENLETSKTHYQVVVGTGTSEDEHVWPL
ncbi:MAG TPA: nucleotidyltransferase domain-containing protein [Candidatus Bathyarchaeia archaeon]|nr:nucleotidyltransferase domain-containing protein [Candidatus Bathyarchaeia archaeon]